MKTTLTTVSTRIEDFSGLVNYIHQLPGLESALSIGCHATVSQHLTVSEMCEVVDLRLSVTEVECLDEKMVSISEVLTMCPQSYRVSTIGNTSYQVREYHGCLFPFFLNLLAIKGYMPR